MKIRVVPLPSFQIVFGYITAKYLKYKEGAQQSARQSLELSGALFCHFLSNYLAQKRQWQPYIAEYP